MNAAFLIAGLVSGGLWLSSTAAISSELRVAIPSPPFGRGDPFQAPGPPAMYTSPAIFDALTWIDGKGGLHPALATSWSVSEDGRTWTFKLRDGVTFSNGRPLDAAAVADVVRVLTINPPVSALNAIEFEKVAGVRALDTLTLEIVSRGPAPMLPRAASILFVVEPDLWRRLGPQGFSSQPVGTGPFKVVTWATEAVRMQAHRESWRAPKVEALTVWFQQDATARLQGLLSGGLDIAMAVGLEDRATIEAEGGTVHTAILPAVVGLMLNATQKGSPFSDVRVRQAVNYAVDKQKLIDAFYGGVVAPVGQPGASVALGHDPDVVAYPYDPARARALLAEAGYAGGFSFAMDAVVGSSGADSAIYQQIASDLAAVGVKLETRSISNARFGQSFRGGGWEAQAFSFFFGAEPAFDALRPLKYYRCSWPATTFCDPTVEPLFAEADSAPTLDGRAQVARKIMAHYHDQASALYLYEAPRFHGTAKRVRGFRIDHSLIHYEDIEIAE